MSLILYVGIGVLLSLVGLVFYYSIPYIFGATLDPSMIGSAQNIFLLLLLNLMILLHQRSLMRSLFLRNDLYSIVPLAYCKFCYNHLLLLA